MQVIGLTGGSGAGKGIVAHIFEKYGIYSVDTDKVAREVCQKGTVCLQELTEQFGQSILEKEGTLNRKKLAEIAFSSPKQREALNRITHFHILKACKIWLEERRIQGDFAAIIDAPLLFESGFDKQCDFIVAVLANRQVRIQRILERDGISLEMAIKRMDAQYTDTFFEENCDCIIWNNGGVAELEKQVNRIVPQIHGKCQKDKGIIGK